MLNEYEDVDVVCDEGRVFYDILDLYIEKVNFLLFFIKEYGVVIICNRMFFDDIVLCLGFIDVNVISVL